jgi:guanine deaminase
VTTDAEWLDEAIRLATANVADGGGPFGAVVAEGDRLLAAGQNRVTRDNDPTAHAEVVAIRRACADKGDFSLAGATLYASCEPCPLCLAAALWARVDRVVYAADRHDAARGGFDDRAFHDLFATDRAQWPTRVEALAVPTRATPFDTWLAHAGRVAY